MMQFDETQLDVAVQRTIFVANALLPVMRSLHAADLFELHRCQPVALPFDRGPASARPDLEEVEASVHLAAFHGQNVRETRREDFGSPLARHARSTNSCFSRRHTRNVSYDWRGGDVVRRTCRLGESDDRRNPISCTSLLFVRRRAVTSGVYSPIARNK